MQCCEDHGVPADCLGLCRREKDIQRNVNTKCLEYLQVVHSCSNGDQHFVYALSPGNKLGYSAILSLNAFNCLMKLLTKSLLIMK